MAAAGPGTPTIRELIVRTPDGNVHTVPLKGDQIAIGRAGSNDLCFAEDAGLSRHHLVFERVAGGWQVRDLNSKNGTFLNGDRLSGARLLSATDRLCAGHLNMEFACDELNPARTVVFIETPTAAPTTSTVESSLKEILEGQEHVGGTAHVQALVRAGRELAGNRPLRELFELILQLSIEAVGAARGVVMIVENGTLVLRAARGEGLRISSAVRDRVLAGESLIVRDARLDELLSGRASIVEQQIRSMAAVPLQTDQRVIGLIYLDSPHFIREFTVEDLNLLTVMANVAAIRIEHVRLAEVEQAERVMARDMQQAAEIQRGLLPAAPPVVPGLDLAGFNAPCRTVGGDYYDFIRCDDGRIAVLVADVAGKGMPAALLVSSLQARAQVLFESPGDLAASTERLNRIIKTTCPGNRFITFFVAVVNAQTGRVDWVNAGHNAPMVLRSDGRVEQLVGSGMVLGILPNAHYEQSTLHLDGGEVLLLFSDGVTELMRSESDEEFGDERLARTLAGLGGASAEQVITGVREAIHKFADGAPPADDVTVVVVRRDKACSGPDSASG